MTPPYDLLTKVLQVHHVVILEDWLKFLDPRPRSLIVYVPDDTTIQDAVSKAARQAQVGPVLVQSVPGDDLRQRETLILQRMASHSTTPWLASVNLDSLCLRRGHAGWLSDDLAWMTEHHLKFLTGCGLIYEADQPVPGREDICKTQRFSNNFAVFHRDFWNNALAAFPVDDLAGQSHERYHSEWAIEESARRQGHWGLRRINSLDWRVMNVQRWDRRLLDTRERFMRGIAIEPYLNIHIERCRYEWERHYDADKPSLMRRMRIATGRWRREVLKRDPS